MKLFLDRGFDLDDASADYKDRAPDLGTRAEASLVKFLGLNTMFKSAVLTSKQLLS
jgi:hypothetical protein